MVQSDAPRRNATQRVGCGVWEGFSMLQVVVIFSKYDTREGHFMAISKIPGEKG